MAGTMRLPCKDGVARKVQHAAAKRAHLTLRQTFTAYGKELERVEVFKYLGRLLAYDDNDTQAVRNNLKKARGIWARLSRTIRAENAPPPCVRHLLQSNRAINITVWKRDMEYVTGGFEKFGRVSYMGCLAYGRQEATETSGRYMGVPKLSSCS